MGYLYPYGDTSQLNLDWILATIKKLENDIGTEISAELETIANALISATYDPLSASGYALQDIVFYNDALWRCNTAIPAGGEPWDSSHWDQIYVGPTLSNLVRAVSGMGTDDIQNDSNVAGVHATDALNNLNTAVSGKAPTNHASSTDTYGKGTDTNYGHVKLTDSLADTTTAATGGLALSAKAGSDLKDAITSVEDGIAIIVDGDTCSTAVPAGGYAYIKNNTHGLAEGLYKNQTSSAFPISGGTANSSVFVSASNVLTVLQEYINSMQKRGLTHPYNISANGAYYTNLKTLIDNDIPSGYKCLGIAGISTGSSWVYPVGFYYENSEYSLQLMNTINTAQSNNCVIYYFIIKA